MCAGACNSVSFRLSVNSSNHSRRSRKRLSEARLSSIFCFGFQRVTRTTFVGLVRHLVLELDLLTTNPAMSMLTTNCFQNWWITLERQEVPSCPFCIQLSSPLWSTVAFDRWPTHRNIRGLRRNFASDRTVSVSSSNCTVTNRSRSSTKTCPSWFVCTSPSTVSTTVEYPIHLSLSLFFANQVH